MTNTDVVTSTDDVMTIKDLKENLLDGFPDDFQVIFEDENGNVKVVASAINIKQAPPRKGQIAVVRLRPRS